MNQQQIATLQEALSLRPRIEYLRRLEDCWVDPLPDIEPLIAVLVTHQVTGDALVAAVGELDRVRAIVAEMERIEEPCSDTPTIIPVDIWFALDTSQSMEQSFAGNPDEERFEAAREAILQACAYINSLGNGSRFALLTFSGGQFASGSPPSAAAFLEYWTGPTEDIAVIEEAFGFIGPFGSTPTGHALAFLEDEILFQMESTTNKPKVILISDGVATMSYGDLADPDRGFLFVDGDVQDVEVRDGMGGFRPIEDVRESGQFYSAFNRWAGEPLADVMVLANALMSILYLQLHGIALDGFTFNDGIIEYVTTVGNGYYAITNNTAETIAAVIAAIEASIYEE